MATNNSYINALVGAVLGFIPFSPLLGGVAGFLERRDGGEDTANEPSEPLWGTEQQNERGRR